MRSHGGSLWSATSTSDSSLRPPAATAQVLTYWAFPAATITNGNAFAVYPASGYRTTAIILMIGHQMVAFLLFIMPVWFSLFTTSSVTFSASVSVAGVTAQVRGPPSL